MLMIRLFVEKLQKGFSFLAPDPGGLLDHEELEVATIMEVPDDVKEGQFAVFAVEGEETQRFVIELGFLTNPAFLRLLEQAEEEFGFKQKGALTVPCRPQELKRILQHRCHEISTT
ncbi:hypothetical protein ACOSP7_029712 [Xanthoceras sorbifolium]|uniref:Uncharacterized protein n=1 Tax=Xanthoceras sorbifolium TaxID=99658 RepID=A0ABQ8HAN9_9ROSI|nr:hypothetical protein JRO89_XS12G0025100 [Xanthoceras sorbifolium]